MWSVSVFVFIILKDRIGPVSENEKGYCVSKEMMGSYQLLNKNGRVLS